MVQIGSYFASNYYQMLQTRPQLVHQFYNNASTMIRLDVATMETATAIGMLVISLYAFTIKIKIERFFGSFSRLH
jgi:Nuclear transport factor 2 (NTF2) domain